MAWNHDGQSGYVRNKDHKKKCAKKDPWRREKDLYYRRDRCRNWLTSSKNFCLKQGSKKHRNWVRQQLLHENYDSFNDREFKRFYDSWWWD